MMREEKQNLLKRLSCRCVSIQAYRDPDLIVCSGNRKCLVFDLKLSDTEAETHLVFASWSLCCCGCHKGVGFLKQDQKRSEVSTSSDLLIDIC